MGRYISPLGWLCSVAGAADDGGANYATCDAMPGLINGTGTLQAEMEGGSAAHTLIQRFRVWLYDAAVKSCP